MRRIKKFSEILNESSSKVAEVQEIVKKLGYTSIDEIKKEKALLTKLEGLMKEVGNDVSEDEAEEIEAKVMAKGKPKSLADAEDKKEEVVSDTDAEVAEDAATDIEDTIVDKGEPKKRTEAEGETVVSDDQEITDEIPAEADDIEAGTPVSRIMTFEEFLNEKETTINKNVRYSDDAEEPEDYSVVVASADPLADEDEEEKEDHDEDAAKDDYAHIADLKKDAHDDYEKDDHGDEEHRDHYKDAAKDDYAHIAALKKDAHDDKEDEDEANEKYDRVVLGGKTISENYRTLARKGMGTATKKDARVGLEIDFYETERGDKVFGKIIKVTNTGYTVQAQERGNNKKYNFVFHEDSADRIEDEMKRKGEPRDLELDAIAEDRAEEIEDEIVDLGEPEDVDDSEAVEISEKEITNEKDFEEYAMKILKQAHPDDFDEELASKVVSDLKAKYKDDFGSMVGALQGGMGS